MMDEETAAARGAVKRTQMIFVDNRCAGASAP